MKSNLRESMQDHCTSEPNLIQHSATDLKSLVISWELSTTGLTRKRILHFSSPGVTVDAARRRLSPAHSLMFDDLFDKGS